MNAYDQTYVDGTRGQEHGFNKIPTGLNCKRIILNLSYKKITIILILKKSQK